MYKVISTIFFFISIMFVTPNAVATFIDIKPIQICNDAGAGCATTNFFEAETDKIWAQAGIDVNFLATTQVNNTSWLDVHYDGSLTSEMIDIMEYGRDNINDSNSTLAINMFFVDTMPGLFCLGCGGDLFVGFCQGLVGIFITQAVFDFNGGIGRLDTIAHEIGHVLELPHISGSDNLMATGGTRTVPTNIGDIAPDGALLSKMSSAQISAAQNSRFVQDTQEIPTPASIYLLMIGLMTLLVRKANSSNLK